MQVGSDGVQACASCHFRGGADPRSINQANPGGNDSPDRIIQLGGPNYQLQATDFPLHKLSNPTDRRSTVLRDVNDVVSSQGVKLTRFLSAEPGNIKDATMPLPDEVFSVRGVNTRRAEPRNTPTVINAAYSRRQFWDTRARNIFNGVNPHGAGDENSKVLRSSGPANLQQVKIRIDNAGLASQAVGPPLSDREMGSVGRTFKDVGRRLASAEPLRLQRVAEDDSVLGPYADRDDNRGLNTTYAEMVRAAFQPVWWQSNLVVLVAQDGSISFIPKPNRPLRYNEFTQIEYNFSLYFGLAIQLYEMTLISSDAPIDRYFEGDRHALTEQELRGLEVFTGETACAACHAGAELTDNSVRILFGAVVNGVKQPAEIVERMFNGDCQVVAYDQGVYNIGVRPTAEDLGAGSNDPFGNPLTFIKLLTTPRQQIPSQELYNYPIPNIADPPIAIGETTVTNGIFKVPSLRNLELTAPYFHNGGQRTIREVVEFYNRGGDFRDQNAPNIDFEIGKLNLTEQEIQDLVSFLGRPLTDLRVTRQSAPFDHPQLFVPNGHKVRNGRLEVGPDGTAEDEYLEVPAVGRSGGRLPKAFLER